DTHETGRQTCALLISPRSVYLLSTCHTTETLSLPVKNHASTHTAKAEICTQPADTHRLVCFVTSVLKTPWILIRAPESSAAKNQIGRAPCRGSGRKKV